MERAFKWLRALLFIYRCGLHKATPVADRRQSVWTGGGRACPLYGTQETTQTEAQLRRNCHPTLLFHGRIFLIQRKESMRSPP